MTMQEKFEAWSEQFLPDDESPRKIAFSAWQAAYRAGQEAMREKAYCAAADEQLYPSDADVKIVQPVVHKIMYQISNLPID